MIFNIENFCKFDIIKNMKLSLVKSFVVKLRVHKNHTREQPASVVETKQQTITFTKIYIYKQL